MAKSLRERLILEGADDPLPQDHFWFEGSGFSVYMATQPKSTWHEHVHDCVQGTIGLEPAHMHAEWQASARLRKSKEFIGNAVTVIPANMPHKTLWQRQAALIHLYIREEMLERIGKQSLGMPSIDLKPTYLVRDLLIEEIARSLYLESLTGALEASIVDAAVTTICVRLLRANNTREGEIAYSSGGLGPSRERKIREYIESHFEDDLSLRALSHVVGLSPQHFSVLFRETTGFTPHQYVNRRRIAYAQQLLSDRALPLIDISLKCGFSSQSQFITTFRKIAGMTPGRFRSSGALQML